MFSPDSLRRFFGLVKKYKRFVSKRHRKCLYSLKLSLVASFITKLGPIVIRRMQKNVRLHNFVFSIYLLKFEYLGA